MADCPYFKRLSKVILQQAANQGVRHGQS